MILFITLGNALLKILKLSEFDIFDFLFIGAVVPGEAFEQKKTLRKNTSALLFFLKNWVDQFTQKNPCWSLKLSGGLDSRLVAYLLRECGHHKMQIHTYYNPEIGVELDADVYCSRQAIRSLNVDAHHFLRPGFPNEYLKPFDSTPEITAIFATELLGGQMFRNLPIQGWVQTKGIDNVMRLIPDDYVERFRNIYFNHIEPLQLNFFLKTFTHSPLSQIYESSASASWSHPKNLFKEFHSPFSSADFVDELSTYNSEDVVDYKLYDHMIYDFKEELLAAPLVSDYCQYFSAQHPPKHLLNSKGAVKYPRNVTSQSDYSPKLKEFVQKYNLDLSEDFIRLGLRRLSHYT